MIDNLSTILTIVPSLRAYCRWDAVIEVREFVLRSQQPFRMEMFPFWLKHMYSVLFVFKLRPPSASMQQGIQLE